jgi:hypothetical protein
MNGGGLEQLRTVLAHAEAVATAADIDAPTLLGALKEVYRGLFTMDFSGYDVHAVRDRAPALLGEIFRLRLALRDRIPEWSARGLMIHPVQLALRDVFRAARYAGDLVGEIGERHPRRDSGEPTLPAFGGPASYTDINPRFAGAPLTFEPGDVVLQRGMHHNSAAIARIGDVDSQFSHVSIVARDPDGQLCMVEALIEDGSLLTPMQHALAHGIGRAVLFRHRDRALAQAASEAIYDYVAARGGDRRVLYDFTMELEGYRLLFCAKLVRLAYSMASTADVQLPAYPTRLDMRNRDFLDRIGVTAVETFAPGDMELESDFDIVAEWRDLRVTSELRLKDMIMTKLFEWMERYDYRFRSTLWIRIAAWLGRLSSHMPTAFQEWLRTRVGKVPPNMTLGAVAAVAMLHKTGEELYADLVKLEADTIRTTGHQLHPRDVLARLERLRERKGSEVGYLVSDQA